jgi:hypothetical protein
MGLRAARSICWQQLLVIREGSYVMEEVLRELTETELESVAGGLGDFIINNQDSNQGIQAGALFNNQDSNQGIQVGVVFV